MKEIRKAVRTFLIEDQKTVIIKYKNGINKDYFDTIGGKIENDENPIEASIREFKEETGMDIIRQDYKGNVIIEYPKKIFDFDIFVVNEYKGKPQEFEENYSMWINIGELLNETKILPSVRILEYLNSNKINLKIYSDDAHNILKIEKI